MVSLDTLVDDIYGLLEGNTLADPQLFDKYRALVGDVVISRLVEDKREPTLRMSNIGRPLRQLWYELNNVKGEAIGGKALFKFAYGHILEALTIILAEASGHMVERLQEEIQVDGIKGHIDCVIDGVLCDVKSCSPYSFLKFQSGELLSEGQDPFGYVGQLCGYAKATGLPAAWVAVNKVSGELHVLHLPREIIERYDIKGRIKDVTRAVTQTTPPDRCYEDEPEGKSGNRKLGIGCSYCAFKFECWKDVNNGKGLQVYAYSNGPKFLTNVAKEPRVFPIKQEKEEDNQLPNG